MNKIVKDAVILTIITLIAGFSLTIVYEITKEPIAQAQQNSKDQAYQAVLEAADSFEAMDISGAQNVLDNGGYKSVELEEAATGYDSSGAVAGYVFTITTHQGYGGDITCTVGMRTDGTVNGIEMLSISETAGLGMKAKEPEFKDQFAGKRVEVFAYTKEGARLDDEIDVITGATVTTSAVTGGVNAAVYYFNRTVEGGAADE